jgi:hypothetical protein
VIVFDRRGTGLSDRTSDGFGLDGRLADLRALSAVRARTLVVHRRGDRVVPFAGGQALATLIPGACLAELDGDDHQPFAGDCDELLSTIEAFVIDTPTVLDGPTRPSDAGCPRPAAAPSSAR